ncbi:ABC transporter permease [Virgibacillus pantothenticus]|uniref:Transport permease protein n=2 Tax=Bacillaceae TaxID=186817 RepID=A0A0L0QT91_VIRPA|nr:MULTISPECIES: ABC transporter permease [Virgibacillus]MBS7427876.1 ABC transporter permease [Virgibacillus sp. 19R1-5]API94199.1 teichoic acid ABC transporter permease [Virgibacillus sp. 6R]KNE21742.1 teichoic acid ABC transporter permease [Virgibacillus pantothenticus]MED3735323.1 ABC transporter permease [Virgibacillus pantothenticus]QTY15969.1 ABC transporter permease [Virgibacillus pantothenticus]
MKSALNVIKEQIENFYLIRRLSIYELKNKNKNNYLGIFWEILNPSIQILIYWFVFSALRSKKPIEMIDGQKIEFFSWLLAAFFLWIFFYQGIIQGSKSIYTRLRMLSKMNFPISIIPGYVIFSQFYVHIMMLVIAIVILNMNGYYISAYYLQLIYYLIATLALIFSISLITSTLSTIIRDIHMLLNSTLRMLLYLSGVLWPLAILGKQFPGIKVLLQLNPLYYLVEGYRAALFSTEWHFIAEWQYSIIFWIIVILLFLLGSTLHVKFRRHFIDYL